MNFSRFCLCPNGHPYYIGDCGQAFTKGKCPECNEEIGGGGHQLLKNNKRMGADDMAPSGYTHIVDYLALDDRSKKCTVAAKEAYTVRRALAVPAYVCVTRLFTHAAMWCGLVMRSDYILDGQGVEAGGGGGGAASSSSGAAGASASSNDRPVFNDRGTSLPVPFYKQMVNREYVNANIDNEMRWIRNQVVMDWRLLIEFLSSNPEDVAKFLHILLDRIHRRPERHNPHSVDMDSTKGIEIDEARRNERATDWTMPYDREKRKSWETCFVKGYLEELIPSKGRIGRTGTTLGGDVGRDVGRGRWVVRKAA